MKNHKKRTYSRAQLVNILYNLSFHKVAHSNRPKDFKDLADLLQTTWWHRRRCDQKEFHQFVHDIARNQAGAIYHQAQALSNVYRYARHWIRAPKDWQPSLDFPVGIDWATKSHWLLRDLLRYLFGYYEVPMFMNDAWVKGNAQTIGWYLHLVNGQNIRTAPDLSIKLSKKMAHYFSQAPMGYGVYKALYYGQIVALGGSLSLYKALMNTQLDHVVSDAEFWLELIQFLINQPEFLANHQVGPLVDFINAKKYVGSVQLNRSGELTDNAQAAMPDFSLKGRTYGSLMRMIRQWHDWLNDAEHFRQVLDNYGTTEVKWKKSPIGDYHYYPTQDSLQWYSIQEVTNSKELFEEGQEMHHCVSAYLSRCISGYCSIWSLSLNDLFVGKYKVITIEVDEYDCIVQARGVYNRMPDREEVAMLKDWASVQSLKYNVH